MPLRRQWWVFDTDDQIIQNPHKIKHIPCVLIQGRYDTCTPAMTAWDIHKAWPEADFKLVGDAGHAGSEPGNGSRYSYRPLAHSISNRTSRFGQLLVKQDLKR